MSFVLKDLISIKLFSLSLIKLQSFNILPIMSLINFVQDLCHAN